MKQTKEIILPKLGRPNERIRLSVDQLEDHDFVNLRQYFILDEYDPEWKPTRKGFCIAAKQWPEFREAILRLDVPAPESPGEERES